MKKLEKLKEWAKKNKALAIIVGMSLVLFIILLIIALELLLGGSSNKYGNRLDGIDDVKISKKDIKDVEGEIDGTGLVEESNVRIQGKIVYTTIVLKADTSKDSAKEIAHNTLDNYTEEELKYYDFSFLLKWNGEEEVVVSGNKHHNFDDITWTNN